MKYVCLMLLLFVGCANQPKVIGVIDGDTIKILDNGTEIKIRLAEIDCPERKQPFGTQAKKYTSDLAFGKNVTLKVKGHDVYGRTLAEVILPDGRNLNRELVHNGYSWWYNKYSKDRTLGQLQQEAKKAKRGLWSNPQAIPPWEWRKNEARMRKSKKAAA